MTEIPDTIFTREEVIAFIKADRLARVPDGFWLAPMVPDAEMIAAYIAKQMPCFLSEDPEGERRYFISLRWQAARDSWLARHRVPEGALQVSVRRLTFVREAPNRITAHLECEGDIPDDRLADVFRLMVGMHVDSRAALTNKD
jgi:hypothetical protein